MKFPEGLENTPFINLEIIGQSEEIGMQNGKY